MEQLASEFPANVKRAIADSQLQWAMTETGPRFIEKRAKARANLPEFDALRDQARDIKDHVLAHLDLYLERYEAKVVQSGGQVHWAETTEEARAAIISICKRLDAKLATKADLLLAGDLGCLMNMAGKLKREGSSLKVRHVAEILAGDTAAPPIAEAE